MKKILLSFLSLLCIGSLAACKDNSNPEDNNTNNEDPNKTIESIVLDDSAVSKSFYLGDEFNSNGLKVLINYSDDSTLDVTGDCQVDSSNFDSNFVGDYVINVYYSTDTIFKQMEYSVEVKEIIPELTTKYVVGLELTEPTKTEYLATEELDLTGLAAKAIYSDGSTKDLTSQDYQVDTSKIDMNIPNDYYEVVVSYSETYQLNGHSQTLTVKNGVYVTVSDVLESISVNTNDLNVVEQYKDIDISGWTITATYVSELSRPVDNSLVTITYDKNTVGEQTAVVTYVENNVTATADVTIVVEKSDEEALEEVFFTADSLATGSNEANFVWMDSTGAYKIDVLAASGKKVDIDANKKTADDGTSFTQRLKLGGSGSATARALVLDLSMYADKQVKITVYCMSSTGSEDRQLDIYQDAFKNGTALGSFTALGASLSMTTITVDGGNVYALGSPSKGVNVYGIRISVVA